MDNGFSGPCWNESDGMILWQLDTGWSDKRIGEAYHHEAASTLGTFRRFFHNESLTKEEYAVLDQKDLLCISGNPDTEFTASLLTAANEVYSRHANALASLCQPYDDMLLADCPALHTIILTA